MNDMLKYSNKFAKIIHTIGNLLTYLYQKNIKRASIANHPFVYIIPVLNKFIVKL